MYCLKCGKAVFEVEPTEVEAEEIRDVTEAQENVE